MKKKLQSVAIYKKTLIFVMRRCSSACCITLKNHFTTGCYMKKFGITIQLFLRYKVSFAGLQDFTPSIICSYINQHLFTSYLTSKEDLMFGNDNDFIRDVIYKKKPDVFNCQNKNYEKTCHFEKPHAAI